MLRDEPPHQRDDVVAERRLLPVAVGKGGIVRHIDEAAVRQQRADRAKHRQPADAGIEDEDRPGFSHRTRSRFGFSRCRSSAVTHAVQHVDLLAREAGALQDGAEVLHHGRPHVGRAEIAGRLQRPLQMLHQPEQMLLRRRA